MKAMNRYNAVLFRNRMLFAFCLVSLSVSGQHSPGGDEGKLFIIGGGAISDSMRRELLEVAQWKKGDLIAAVTLASSWDSSYININSAFKALTGEDCLRIDSATIRDGRVLDEFKKARLIFLGGGDQVRFMERIAGTPVKSIIQQAYRSGATVAGTSAGASVMCRMMITGTSKRDSLSSTALKGIWRGSVDYSEGLGLLDSVIIDQHFVVRSRYNRMISSLLDHPAYQCIGINESTAIVVKGTGARVTGESQVLVLQDPVNPRVGADSNQGASALRFSLLLSGDHFTIRR